MEGLNASMKRAVSISVFEGFKVDINGLEVSHLQYDDDLVLVGVPFVENLLTIKDILRSFELA